MDRAQVLHRMMREELSQELLGKWVHWQHMWHKTMGWREGAQHPQ